MFLWRSHSSGSPGHPPTADCSTATATASPGHHQQVEDRESMKSGKVGNRV